MIGKSGHRFSSKIMRNENASRACAAQVFCADLKREFPGGKA
jgi:hypothetical protein